MASSRRYRLLLVVLCGGALVSILSAFDVFHREWPAIFTDGYPRAFFFRKSENMITDGYTVWEKTFSRLGGIMGKTLNEELLNRKRTLPYFQKFKRRNPDQAVFLHYNGNARDPLEGQAFFPGHWLYYEGTPLLQDLPKGKGQITIKVKDASIFKLNIGRYKNKNDDVAICRRNEDGSLNWNYAEQLTLVDADYEDNTITVNRGQYGTLPLAFDAGKSIVSPHVVEGPWGEDNNLLWLYNHSTACPKDRMGRTCDDVLIADVAGKFASGGELNLFDGVEFDVLWNEFRNGNSHDGARKIDVNNDGKGDNGYVDGVNVYSVGVFNFCRDFRKAMGPEKLIMADGMTARFQRGVGYLNGIESEGWPHLRDPEIEDWSGGWNRHMFWNENAMKPAFSFVNFKYAQNVAAPEIGRQRLVWATSQLMDAFLASGGYRTEPDEQGIRLSIIDEVYGGTRQEKSWLGDPLGPTVRVALTTPDLLNGTGKSLSEDFVSRLSGKDVAVSVRGGSVTLSGRTGDDARFAVNDIPTSGPDLVISVEIMCEPRDGYPADMPRLLTMHTTEAPFKQMTWMNGKWFKATFYLRDVATPEVDLLFEAESPASVMMRNMTVHAAPDVAYREFRNGIILVNPAHHSYRFDLKDISPKSEYFRLKATPGQDTVANNGLAVGNSVVLGEREGLFLERRE